MRLSLNEFWDWRFALRPLAVTRSKFYVHGGCVGIMYVHVFGFVVATIQETKPWS